MKQIFRFRRSTVVVIFISACLFIFTQCINEEEGRQQEKPGDSSHQNITLATIPSYNEFAGSKKCMGCHKDIYEAHLNTAHYQTSQQASERNIDGSFKKGNNTFSYNPNLLVAMEKRDSGLFQVVYFKGEEKVALPFDMVIGSGTKGQSFAYWKNNWLYQLPITYFTAAAQWSNSPGFPMKVMMDRPITSRCLECHATYVDKISAPESNQDVFDRNRIIYGVDCEKCHGPAARHIEFQTQNSKDTSGKFIINPAKLTRQQNLDLCALCHGGNIQKTQPPFSFIAGNVLSDHFQIDSVSDASAAAGNFDVHGNQYGLLRASKCFRLSETLTCNSCHGAHANEKGNTVLFSQRCMNCHSKEHNNFCKMNPALVPGLEKNCIDCHMPEQPSRSIALFLPGKDVPVASMIRSHFISIYKQETQKFLGK